MLDGLIPPFPRRVIYVADRLARALVGRDAAEEGRARLKARSSQMFEDHSSGRSAERSPEESAGGSAGGRDTRLSRAEHEVKLNVFVWSCVVL